MRNTAFVIRRGGVFWFRRRPPLLRLRLHYSLGQTGLNGETPGASVARGHLSLSLRTGCPLEARRRAARIGLLFEFGWAAYEKAMIQTPPQDGAAGLQQEFARGLLEVLRKNVAQAETLMALAAPDGVKATALDQNDAASRREIAAIAQPSAAAAEAAAQAARCRNPFDDPEFEAAVVEFAEQNGWFEDNPEVIVEEFDNMLGLMLAMLDDYVKHCARKGLDPASALPSIAAMADGLKEVAVVLNIKVDSPQADAQAPGATQVVQHDPTPLSEFSARYLDLRCRGLLLKRRKESPDEKTGDSFRANSRRNIEATIALFIDLFGDMPVADIHDLHCSEFVATLCRIPATHGKSNKDRRPLREVVADADREQARAIETLTARMRQERRSPGEIEDAVAQARIERLRTNTAVRHMRDFSRVLDFAIFDGLRGDNPMKEHIWTAREIKNRTSRETGAQRTGWGDDIAQLLASPIYRDPLDEPGDALFWAPLLGLFAGLRMEEALQLGVDDFKTERGEPFISVQISDPAQILKTETSRRRVPLHRALVELGLLKLVELRRDNQQGRIFTHLERGKSKGKLSDNFSKRFTHYRKSNGIYQQTLDFHSLRTEFQTLLTYAKVPEHTRKYLMGHAITDITHANYYRAGDPISTLRKFVDLIDIDISAIRRPFGSAAQTTGARGLRVVS